MSPITEPENFVPTMTVDEVREEVMLLNPENIRLFPIPEGQRDDFRSLWVKSGPQAGRDVMIASIWYGAAPRPSEYFGKTT